ncbi:MAG: zinc ribbon domain-containing protein [Chloroflexota bacterium]
MFDDLFGELDSTLSGFFESDVFQIGLRVIVVYFVLIWLASAYWAYRDMRLRTASAVAPYIAAGAIIIFTPVFFLFGLLLYRIVRPKETIAEVSERALAEEAIMSEVATHAQCANCSRPVHEDWIICPTCRNRLRRVCPNCEHLIELDWTLCAWCGKDFERAEPSGAAAYMPTARPAPQLHEHAQPRPAPPPPARVPPPPVPPQAGQPRKTVTPDSAAPTQATAAPAGSAQAAAPKAAAPQTPGAPQARQQPAPRSSQATSAAPTPAPPPSSGGTQPATGER